MKKLSIFLLAVLLTVSLFVSCDNTTKAVTDERVAVTFSTGADSRSLSYAIEDVSELNWYYTAQKNSADTSPFSYGATTAETPITLGSRVEFSQGLWDFTLCARRVDTRSDGTKIVGEKVYQGSPDGSVLITKETSPKTIVIPVSPAIEDVTGFIMFEDVTIDLRDGDEVSTVYANIAEIEGVENPIDLTAESVESQELLPGDYRVTVKYTQTIDGTIIEFASETITVTVWSGRTTIVSGNISEETDYVIIDGVEVVGLKATAPITPNESESVSVIIPLTPSEEQGTETTVKFDAGALPEGTSKVVTEVKTIEESQSANFEVTDGFVAVAAIDLKIADDSGDVKAITGGKSVNVTTYILKGLTNVSVKYNGTDGDDPTFGSYDPETGKLIFTTTHFSEFFVESDAVCYSEKKGKGYSSLVKAAAESSSNDTIHLLSDIDFSNYVDDDNDGNVISRLYGTLDGYKNESECYKIVLPRSEDIMHFVSKYYKLTLSNLKFEIGDRPSIVPLLDFYNALTVYVHFENVDYSGLDKDYFIGHNSSVYGSYFGWDTDVLFENCDVNLNLDGTQSDANPNMAVFYGGYHLNYISSTKITVNDCSYSGNFRGPYVALVLSNGQNITSDNTIVSGLENNGVLFGLLGANAVGAQNPSKTISFEVTGKENITKAEDSSISILKDNDKVSFTESNNSLADSYILHLAGVREIYYSDGTKYSSNYNYGIKFANLTPGEEIYMYKMVDYDTAKSKYGFIDDDFNSDSWKETGSYYEGNGKYCVAEKNGTYYYIIKFEDSGNGDYYRMDTNPTVINVLVRDSEGKLIEIKTSN